jgi:hypothetical protein
VLCQSYLSIHELPVGLVQRNWKASSEAPKDRAYGALVQEVRQLSNSNCITITITNTITVTILLLLVTIVIIIIITTTIVYYI